MPSHDALGFALDHQDQQFFRKTFAALLCALGGVYWFCLPTTVPDFDSGEFYLIAHEGGIAHPPGYPLYCIILKTVTLLFGGQASARVLAAVSLVFVVAAAAVLHHLMVALLRELTHRPLSENWLSIISGLCVFVVFTSTPLIRAATAIEPFGLHLFLCASIMSACWFLLQASSTQHKWAYLIGVLFGLSACNHSTAIMLVPLGILTLLYHRQDRLGHLSRASGGFIVGLMPLFYFATQHEKSGFIWGDWTNFNERLFVHLFRSEYGTFSLSTATSDVPIGGNLIDVALRAPMLLSFIFAVFWLMGLWLSVKEPVHDNKRCLMWYKVGLFAAFILSGPVFFSLTQMVTEEEFFTLQRFYAFPLMLSTLYLVMGTAFAAHHCASRLQKSRFWVLGLLAGLALALHTALHVPTAVRSEETLLSQHVSNILALTPENSTLLVWSDGTYFGLLNAMREQQLQQRRVIAIGLLNRGTWYSNRIEAELGPLPLQGDFVTALVRRLQQTGPVFLVADGGGIPNGKTSLLNELPSYPIGPLIAFQKSEDHVLHPSELLRVNEQVLTRLSLPPLEQLTRLTPWEENFMSAYALSWKILESIEEPLIQAGEKEKIQAALKRLGVSSPSR